MKHLTWPLIVAVALCGLLVACEQHDEKTVSGAFPLEKVVFQQYRTSPVMSWQQDIGIYLAKGADLSSVVDQHVFADFHPGMTGPDALNRFGKPVQARTDDLATWYRYPTSLGYLEIGCQKSTSPSGPPDNSCIWRLYAFTRNPPEAILRPPILEQLRNAEAIRPKAGWRSMVIHDSHGLPIMDVWLRSGRIERIGRYK
jgi:hypothetical protein